MKSTIKCVNPWLVDVVCVPNWLMIRTEIGPSAKLVLAVMGQEAEEGLYSQTMKELALRVGTSSNRLTSALNELKTAGLLLRRDEGFLVVVPVDWMNNQFTNHPDGSHEYDTHEPGQWWMSDEGFAGLDENGDPL